MAGQGMSFLRAGRKYGVDPRLLVGIATIESSAGQHEKIRYNPFNWGVHRGQSYGSYEEAIMDVARGLRRGYLDQGLTTPQQIVSKYAPSSDGNNESNWAKVVGQVMGQLGGNVPAGATPSQGQRGIAAALSPTPPSPQAPSYKTEFDPALFSRNLRNQFIAGGGRIDLMGLGQTRQESYVPVPIPQPPAPQQGQPMAKTGHGPVAPQQPVLTGKGISLPITYKSTHVTDGLTDQGFTRAIDIMGAPGTPVRAPMEGTVLYFHPNGAQGGGSMEVRFADGRVGWIGHIANGLPAGAKVRAGTELAVISADHPRPHVHWDLR